MNKSHRSQAIEPLWSMPQSIIDRLGETKQNSEYQTFLLCGFYCFIAILFLIFFGIAALLRQDPSYAYTIFGFALATVICYGSIWLSGLYGLGKHFVALLMATLCLYLFYTGGTQGTGPIFFFIFPLVAVFLQGYRAGLISIICLSIIAILIYRVSLLGFNPEQYDPIFITRVLAVYIIISILSTFFAFFRHNAEREIGLIHEDIDQISYLDQITGVANRNLMEKLLNLELGRYARYRSKFSVILLTIDSFKIIQEQNGRKYADSVLASVAQILNKALREPDILARWETEEFFILLPETTLTAAAMLAERLRTDIANSDFYHQGNSEKVTFSMGISEATGDNISDIIHKADKNLFLASKVSGNSIVT